MAPLVLTVDDDKETNRILEQRFKELGADVVTTTTVADFIRELGVRQPQLLFIDMNIEAPSDGLALIKEIRKKRQMTTPIVICSGIQDVKAIIQALEEGANDYLVKPLHRQTFLKSVKHFIHVDYAEDDNISNLGVVPEEDSLSSLAYDVKVLEISEDSISAESPHLIRKRTPLKIGGSIVREIFERDFVACVAINNELIPGEIPSYRIELEFEEMPEEALRALRSWLISAQDKYREQNIPAPESEISPDRVVDWAIVQELVEAGGMPFTLELLDGLVKKFSTALPEIKASLDRNDASAVAFHAHSLKSSSGNLGLCRVQRLTENLEMMAAADDLSEASALLTELESIFFADEKEMRQKMVVA